MITAEINFTCGLCGNNKEFYLMPMDEPTISKDIVRSVTRFKLQCKICGKNSLLKFVTEDI